MSHLQYLPKSGNNLPQCRPSRGKERRLLSVFIYKSSRIRYAIFFILKTTKEYVYIIFRMCGVKMRISGVRNIPGGKSAKGEQVFYESFMLTVLLCDVSIDLFKLTY